MIHSVFRNLSRHAISKYTGMQTPHNDSEKTHLGKTWLHSVCFAFKFVKKGFMIQYNHCVIYSLISAEEQQSTTEQFVPQNIIFFLCDKEVKKN